MQNYLSNIPHSWLVECWHQVQQGGTLIPGQVKSMTNFTPVASLVSVYHLRLEQGWLAQCEFKVTGWGIMFLCSMVLWCAGK